MNTPRNAICERIYDEEPCMGDLEPVEGLALAECDTCYACVYTDGLGNQNHNFVVCLSLEDNRLWHGHREMTTALDLVLALCADKKAAKKEKKWLKKNPHPQAAFN